MSIIYYLNKIDFRYIKPMKTYQETLSQLFKAFVKNADVRNDVLEWIGDCFQENQGDEFS